MDVLGIAGVTERRFSLPLKIRSVESKIIKERIVHAHASLSPRPKFFITIMAKTNVTTNNALAITATILLVNRRRTSQLANSQKMVSDLYMRANCGSFRRERTLESY